MLMRKIHRQVPDRRLCQADFDYQLQPGNLLVMQDLDMGGRSLTNDMAAALQEVARLRDSSLAGYVVIYRDSDGSWARVLLDTNGDFAGFAGLGQAVYDQATAEHLIRQQVADDGRR